MSQPLRSALPAVRASTSALRTSPHAITSRSSSQRMSSIAAYPVEEPHSPSFDLNILDIFDAPSRLGESSRLLVSNAAASSTIRRARRPPQASHYTHTIKPLPEPVVLDGPARPRNAPFVSFRAFGNTAGPRRNVSTSTGVWSPPAPLPPPILFDGPSQLRPYHRGGAGWNGYSVSWTISLGTREACYLLYIKLFADSASHGSLPPWRCLPRQSFSPSRRALLCSPLTLRPQPRSRFRSRTRTRVRRHRRRHRPRAGVGVYAIDYHTKIPLYPRGRSYR